MFVMLSYLCDGGGKMVGGLCSWEVISKKR
jgi:hypothetical protein